MKNIKYTIDQYTLHLIDSYKYPKKEYDRQLNMIEGIHPTSEVWLRSRKSLKREWASHNALYDLKYKRDHTQNCDLEYPQRWWDRVRFNIFGALVWPFIK